VYISGAIFGNCMIIYKKILVICFTAHSAV
jgi:hypothetical protein